jgi:hypothetical protein
MPNQIVHPAERREAPMNRLRKIGLGITPIIQKSVGQDVQRFGFDRAAMKRGTPPKAGEKLGINTADIKHDPTLITDSRFPEPIARRLREEWIIGRFDAA